MALVQIALPIEDTSGVGAARRAAAEIAHTLALDELRSGEVALAVTEIATNILKHAGRGQIVLRPMHCGSAIGMEILGLDQGPGIANPSLSIRDGHSTAGTSGTGLGALARLSSGFEIYSHGGKGTAVRLELWSSGQAPPAESSVEIGAVCLPMPGEAISGDAWAVARHARGVTVLVADGLGHGPEAYLAANAAIETLKARPDEPPAALMEWCHGNLAKTRGAAGAAAHLDTTRALGSFAGIGNVVCQVESAGTRRNLMSYNGILGHTLRKVQEFQFPYPPGALAILHSDGLATQWSLANYPGLAMKHPGLIAGVLYRDYYRGRDDVTVLVARNAA